MVTEHQLKPLVTNQNAMSHVEQGLNEHLKEGEAFSEIDNLNFNMKNYSAKVERTFHQVVDVAINITKMIKRFQTLAFKDSEQDNNKILSLLQLSAHK